MNIADELRRGIVKEHPLLVLSLGICPSIAITTTLMNGFSLGLLTLIVLLVTNPVISLLRNVVPDTVRLPVYLIIIATPVTIVQLILHAYFPETEKNLGIFVPLLVVNCVILGRAQAFAAKNTFFSSLIDAAGMGIGFLCALCCIAAIREVLGSNTLLGHSIISGAKPLTVFALVPGGFFILALVKGLLNHLTRTPKGVEHVGI